MRRTVRVAPRLLALVAIIWGIAPVSAWSISATIDCVGGPCAGVENDTITFAATVQNASGPVSYQWAFGDGSVSPAPSPSHTYTRPHSQASGGWTVTLIVTDNLGPSQPATKIVPIDNVAPTAVAKGMGLDGFWTTTEFDVFVNNAAQFDASESSDAFGAITLAWDWDWDGNPANFETNNTNSPTAHSWSTPETITVGLRVNDGDGWNNSNVYAQLTVHVLPLGPVARVIPPSLPFNEGEPATFKDDSIPSTSPIVKWEWDFEYEGVFAPDIINTTDDDVIHTYESIGPTPTTPYLLALQVTDQIDRKHMVTIQVRPQNILPEADLKVRDLGGNLLSPVPDAEGGYYQTQEGVKLRFDSTDSAAVPGWIQGRQYDWSYNGITADWSIADQDETVVDHAWNEDSENGNFGEFYVVLHRVTDDDSIQGAPSEDFVELRVQVLDIPPQAEIYGDDALEEGENGYFGVRIIGGSTDPIKQTNGTEWCFDFNTAAETCKISWLTGTFTSNLVYSYPTIGYYAIKVNVTDDDGDTASDTFVVQVNDKPPTVVLEKKTAGPVLEGAPTVFTIRNTRIGPQDRYKAFYWDDNYSGAFTPNPSFDEETPACIVTVEGQRCDNATWVACTSAADCPTGLGEIELMFGNGPNQRTLAVCVEDDDAVGRCLDNPGSGENDFFKTLVVDVQNVAPEFNLAVGPNREIDEGQYYSFIPQAVDPGALDRLSFKCNRDIDPSLPALPLGMTCNADTGHIEWFPQPEHLYCIDEQEYPVVMVVEDNDGGRCHQLCPTCDTYCLEWNIRVTNVNDPPEINGFNGGPTAEVGAAYSGILNVYDADQICGENLTFYLCGGKSGMGIGPDGTFRWTPTADQLGQHSVRLCVHDDDMDRRCDETAICWTQTIQVVNPNLVPRCDAGEDQVTPPSKVCQVGDILSNPGDQALQYDWSISGPAEVCLFDPSEYPADPSVCFATTVDGIYTLTLEVTDPATDLSSICSATVTITDVEPTAVVNGPRHYEPGSQMELDGRRSGDLNRGDGYTFEWSDPYGVLEDNRTFDLVQFNDLYDIGAYSFDFVLHGAGGIDSEPANVTFELLDLDNNLALPYAHLLPVPPAQIADEVILDASSSSARIESVALAYQWAYLDGPVPEAELDWGTFPGEEHRLRVYPNAKGNYLFGLTVNTGETFSRQATMPVIVGDPNNTPPRADAGQDIETALLSVPDCQPPAEFIQVSLDGSRSRDPEQLPLTYEWRQIDGITLPLNLSNPAKPSFYAFDPGLYSFELVVSDGVLRSAPDIAHVTVSDVGNTAPYAVLPLDVFDPVTRTITVSPGFPVLMDARGSADPDHDLPLDQLDPDLRFEWTQLAGPPVVLSSWKDPLVTFDSDVIGITYTFRLTIWDEHRTPSLPLDINVEVLSEYNQAPICLAEKTEITTVVGTWETLDGSGSYDPDEADTIACAWTQILEDGETPMTIIDADKPVAQAQSLEEGVFTFQLLCSDGKEACKPPETVVLTVISNSTPVADAGDDIIAYLGDEVQLNGIGSYDPDGHELSYAWIVLPEGNTIGVSEEELLPSNEDSQPSFTAFDTGTATFQLVVSDGFPGGDSEPDTVLVRILQSDGDDDPIDGDEVPADEDGIDIDGDSETTEEEGGGGCSGCAATPVGGGMGLLLLGLLAAWRRRRRSNGDGDSAAY